MVRLYKQVIRICEYRYDKCFPVATIEDAEVVAQYLEEASNPDAVWHCGVFWSPSKREHFYIDYEFVEER